MTDRDDRILDACLEEILGEQTPPDLSHRILHALAARAGSAAAVPLPDEAPHPVRPAPIPLRDNVSPVPASPAERSMWRSPAWFAAAVAVGLLIAVVGYRLMAGKTER